MSSLSWEFSGAIGILAAFKGHDIYSIWMHCMLTYTGGDIQRWLALLFGNWCIGQCILFAGLCFQCPINPVIWIYLGLTQFDHNSNEHWCLTIIPRSTYVNKPIYLSYWRGHDGSFNQEANWKKKKQKTKSKLTRHSSNQLAFPNSSHGL